MSPAPLPTTAKKNVEAIALVEQQLHGRRTRAERIGSRVARFFGSLWFVAAHGVLFTVWIVLNSTALPGVAPFDPYPFPFLGVVVAIEFIVLTTFVLMNQNLQSKRQEHWGHLTLQVCLLAEQEVTKNLRMLQLISRHVGLEEPGADQESNDMARTTPVTALAAEIDQTRKGLEPRGERNATFGTAAAGES
jgi:uncharacterized membrane protein